MISHRQLFLHHLAQTSPAPLGIEVDHAEGVHLVDPSGKKYVDLISGISVSNVGHRHPKVVEAIKLQLDRYMHVMVYGEYVQAPQVLLAQKIASLLPPTLNCTYFTNSGTEAAEGAMKLAKRITGRAEIISFENAYHGSTQGALSVMGSEFFKTSFRPLLPGTKLLPFNDIASLKNITEKTACVIVEPIQGEAGAIVGDPGFLTALQKRCKEKGTLLIYDEIQTGFGRSGKMFGFEHSATIPDIILFAKGLGGGLPIGAFVASKENMQMLTNEPVLGHITTFGGNAVCCAAALATITVIEEEKLADAASEKESIIRDELKSKRILSLNGKGLMFAAELESAEKTKAVIVKCVNEGVITDWFLFKDNALRIAPPLNIDGKILADSLRIINTAIDKI
ncbi:MAG TPA: aspartate aminotransferase family protein [Bacteroidia bacterium]|jgi:acetylornithine/succinyldiaminopimelate/putrescine aminotransferase|nr:aspartate aminotransferase family protein [Bacteroidia bacterium]